MRPLIYIYFFRHCKIDPAESIRNIFSQLQRKYCEKSSQLSDINTTEVNHRALLALKLVYKFLEHILKSERKRNPDISVMQQFFFGLKMFICRMFIFSF